MEKNPLNEPIARGGESIYASIVRNRSGIDSGCIDYGLRIFEVQKLREGDKQDIANTAFALYESICRAAGKHAELDNVRTQLAEKDEELKQIKTELFKWKILSHEEIVDRLEKALSAVEG